MEFTQLNKLANKIGLTLEKCKKVLLDFSNVNGVKLLHSINGNLIIPTTLYNDVINVERYLNSRLTPYSDILIKKSDKIPFLGDGYVYFLFLKGNLVYIGQTINISQRIGTHYYSNKVFDEVYAEPTHRKELLLTEALYINRDKPETNVTVISPEEYLQTLLSSIDIDKYLY